MTDNQNQWGQGDMDPSETYYDDNTGNNAPHGYQMVNLGFNPKSQDQIAPVLPYDSAFNNSTSNILNNGRNAGRFSRRVGIHWWSVASVVGFFLASLALAIGHDQFYACLDGKVTDTSSCTLNHFNYFANPETSKQTWTLRYGTGLAFLVKTGLSVVVAIVAAQQVWYTLRRKAMTVGDIDNMFGMMNTPLAFGNVRLLWHAKTLSVLAIVSWCLPLVSVVAPATLSVELKAKTLSGVTTVPTFNLSDTTHWVIDKLEGPIGGFHFDIGALFSNMYTSAGAGQAGVVPINPPPFQNASYDMSFHGPSYKCSSLSDLLVEYNGTIPATWTLGNPKLATYPNYTTFIDAYYGELQVPRPDVDSDDDNLIMYSAAAPTYMENTIMVATAGINPLWDDGSVANKSDPWATMQANIICQLYNTSYDISLQFNNGAQTVIPRNVQLLERQAWSGDAGADTVLGACSQVGNVTSATSFGNCSQATTSYYATHLMFSYLLTGVLYIQNQGSFGYKSAQDSNVTAQSIPLMQSPFIHCPDTYNFSIVTNNGLDNIYDFNPARCRNGTLAAAIEDLSRNFTYSMLAFDSWTKQPVTDANVTIYYSDNYFVYQRGTLWAAYASALGATVLAMAFGARALMLNGVFSSTNFSSTLLTTRNPELRNVLFHSGQGGGETDAAEVFKRSNGAQPVAPAVRRLKLRFGSQVDDNGAEYVGFGIARE
ncbi:hypothetical protein SEUCBS139899_005409 [Sporothrix eucalyptigena]|uniref:Uncharacterized protein n=1 Tax=Sporothrix eucalyptigena TaxID=1812306 RepID=A0ABP0CY23_9PEZI